MIRWLQRLERRWLGLDEIAKESAEHRQAHAALAADIVAMRREYAELRAQNQRLVAVPTREAQTFNRQHRQ